MRLPEAEATLINTIINPNCYNICTTSPIDALDAGARFELATFSSWGWWDDQTSLPCNIQTVQFLSALTDTVQHRSIINTIVSIHSRRDLTIISHGTFRFSWPNRTFALETALVQAGGLEPPSQKVIPQGFLLRLYPVFPRLLITHTLYHIFFNLSRTFLICGLRGWIDYQRKGCATLPNFVSALSFR